MLPRSLKDLDRWPTPVLLALGLIPAAAVAWLAAQSPLATAALVLLIPVAAVWQGARVRVVWERGIPQEQMEVPPQRRPVRPGPAQGPEQSPSGPEPAPAPQPPYPVQDPLLELMMLLGGLFWMGSDPALDPQAYSDEQPRRRVRVGAFAMARTPVTRGLYRALMQMSPSEWEGDKDDSLPANYVSWKDAVRFCNALSARSGRSPCYRQAAAEWICDWEADGYRLPTEAEWEYACRAGTEAPWFWGRDAKEAVRYAWLSGNSGNKPHPVGQKDPNPWGLYDLAGNVWEWCWDWYVGAYDPQDLEQPRGPRKGEERVLRGGSFVDVPGGLRSAARLRAGGRFTPVDRDGSFGFRCVRGSGRQLGH
jgi:formylglycine-generating enzyme required for sulfatase activity